MLLISLVGIAAWVILYPAQQLWTIYLSRIVGGVGGGMLFMAVPLYVGEIAEVSLIFNLEVIIIRV